MNFDSAGRLWATDNQGDWLGTSKLFHVKEGNFYGHPASLVWTGQWEVGRNPLKVPPAEFDAQRKRAAVLFPQGSMANSPTQMLTDTTDGEFGPFAGQLLVGEMNARAFCGCWWMKWPDKHKVPVYLYRWRRPACGRHLLAFAPTVVSGRVPPTFWAGGSGLQRHLDRN